MHKSISLKYEPSSEPLYISYTTVDFGPFIKSPGYAKEAEWEDAQRTVPLHPTGTPH